MNYEMNLENKYFNLIKAGKKKIEMRLNRIDRRDIKALDTITFKNNQTLELLTCLVASKALFRSFYDLYRAYPKSLLGYLPNEASNPSDMNRFYSDADIEKYGVVAIEITPIANKND